VATSAAEERAAKLGRAHILIARSAFLREPERLLANLRLFQEVDLLFGMPLARVSLQVNEIVITVSILQADPESLTLTGEDDGCPDLRQTTLLSSGLSSGPHERAGGADLQACLRWRRLRVMRRASVIQWPFWEKCIQSLSEVQFPPQPQPISAKARVTASPGRIIPGRRQLRFR
jgi:hypothetical protein